MAKIQFSKEEILSGAIVTPGWYNAEIMKIDEKPKKDDDGSINVFVTVKLTSGEYAGCAIYGYLFNTKAVGFAKDFIAAVMGIEPRDLKAGEDFEVCQETCGGKQVDVYVINDEYNGKPTNKLADWAMFGTRA